MPPWAWSVVLAAVGMAATLVFTIWKFGLSAGKLTEQMLGLGRSLDGLASQFKEETRAFRDQLHSTSEQMGSLDKRLIWIEARTQSRTPASGVPIIAGGEPK